MHRKTRNMVKLSANFSKFTLVQSLCHLYIKIIFRDDKGSIIVLMQVKFLLNSKLDSCKSSKNVFNFISNFYCYQDLWNYLTILDTIQETWVTHKIHKEYYNIAELDVICLYSKSVIQFWWGYCRWRV